MLQLPSRSFCPLCDLPSSSSSIQPQRRPTTCLNRSARSTSTYIRYPFRRQSCLAAAALRSTSPASATERALATSPTSSNGMSPTPRPSPTALASSSVLAPEPVAACCPRFATVATAHVCSAVFSLVAPQAPPAPSFGFSHAMVRMSVLTILKIWPPGPLRYSGSPFGFV